MLMGARVGMFDAAMRLLVWGMARHGLALVVALGLIHNAGAPKPPLLIGLLCAAFGHLIGETLVARAMLSTPPKGQRMDPEHRATDRTEPTEDSK